MKRKPSPATSQLEAFFELTKPRITFLILVSTALGFYLGSQGEINSNQFILTIIWKNWFSSKKLYFDGNLQNKTNFLPKTTMVCMVHTNHFYEISLQTIEPKIELSMKTHFF